MTGVIYMHDLGDVRISEREAHFLETIQHAQHAGIEIPTKIASRYRALMRDIERVARWKSERRTIAKEASQ